MGVLYSETFVSIASSVIENVIIYQYFIAVLRKKIISEPVKILTIVIGLTLLFISTQFVKTPFTRIVITTLVLAVYSLQYEGKTPIRILLVFSYISLAAIAEELAASTISLMPSVTFQNSYVTRFLSILLASIFLILLIELLSTFVFKSQKIIYFESRIYYVLTPLFSVILTLLFFFDLHTTEYQIMALILLGGINLCFFVMIKTIDISFEIKSQLAKRDLELKYQRNVAEKNINQFREVRKKTHDTNKHLILIKGLIQDGDINNALAHLNEYLDIIDHSISKSSTGHVGIDSMLDYCYEICKKEGIELVLKTEINHRTFSIDDIDIPILLGNIIDNAVEANNKISDAKNKKIELKIFTNHKHLFVQSINTVSGQVNVHKTSKPDKNQHGYGISTIKQIADKYEGICTIDISDNLFSIVVVLPYR